MEKENEHLHENVTLTGIRDILQETKVKKSNEPFTTGDAQGYITRGKLPGYLGGNKIVESPLKVVGTKLYNILK